MGEGRRLNNKVGLSHQKSLLGLAQILGEGWNANPSVILLRTNSVFSGEVLPEEASLQGCSLAIEGLSCLPKVQIFIIMKMGSTNKVTKWEHATCLQSIV
eukprot:Blabericola_migrator_1__8449@NODE_4405_length_1177_cov_11_269369_g2724_i0_p3_GENE_NODE_4405_length_1177_cov_11_269369_g2724_i0NODE_4405_length_1177_cov_11_269369_g2724_i0_p3_ORF_typecomplete_len100_score6_69_NODE_4405_length_1177_cov_11_269369_g2724_i0619918